MKALVKFISCPPIPSWDCPIGRAYQAATCDANPVLALAMGLYEDAARGEFANERAVFSTLQNVDINWREANPEVECLTAFPRSMMVGDLIVWEDGTCYICDRHCWTDLAEFKKEGWTE